MLQHFTKEHHVEGVIGEWEGASFDVKMMKVDRQPFDGRFTRIAALHFLRRARIEVRAEIICECELQRSEEPQKHGGEVRVRAKLKASPSQALYQSISVDKAAPILLPVAFDFASGSTVDFN